MYFFYKICVSCSKICVICNKIEFTTNITYITEIYIFCFYNNTQTLPLLGGGKEFFKTSSRKRINYRKYLI